MEPYFTPDWVASIGLLVGTIGVCSAIALTMVSPYAHSLWSRVGFLFLGTAIILLSSEPIISEPELLIAARTTAIAILSVFQLMLLGVVLYFGPFRSRGRALQGRLGAEGDDEVGTVELRLKAKDEENSPDDPFEHLKFWK